MRSLLFTGALLPIALASPHLSHGTRSTAAPTVKLDSATVTGASVQLQPNSSVIEQYLGIPFAQAPYALFFVPLILLTLIETCAPFSLF